MEIIPQNMTPEEEMVYGIIDGREYIYHGSLAHKIHMDRFKHILLHTFGRRLQLASTKRGAYRKFRIVKVDKRQDYTDVLPCMLPRAAVERCNHVKDCYLSRHCPAVK